MFKIVFKGPFFAKKGHSGITVITTDRQGDGMKPGSRSRDAKSRDGTGMSFQEFPGSGTSLGKPGWDRDAPLNPGIPAIPDLCEIYKNSGKKCECRTIKVSAYN